MNIAISYKEVDGEKAVSTEVSRRLDKLGRLLKSYEPDLVQIIPANYDPVIPPG